MLRWRWPPAQLTSVASSGCVQKRLAGRNVSLTSALFAANHQPLTTNKPLHCEPFHSSTYLSIWLSHFLAPSMRSFTWLLPSFVLVSVLVNVCVCVCRSHGFRRIMRLQPPSANLALSLPPLLNQPVIYERQ